MKILSWAKTSRTRIYRIEWHGIFAGIILLGALAALVGLLTGRPILLLIAKFVLLSAILTGFFAILLLLYENVRSLKDNAEKLETTAEMINKNRALLGQINNAARLRDTAKGLAFRDTERMEITEAVLGKLHQHDFDSTYAMIEAMAARPEFKRLAEQLKKF